MARVFVVAGSTFAVGAAAASIYHTNNAPSAPVSPLVVSPPVIANGFVGAVGNTPMIELDSLSKATGCRILAKAEFLNPGASVKDRAAARMLQELALNKPTMIVEGTGGNTGVGLALIAKSMGIKSTVVVPANVSDEKVHLLRTINDQVLVQPVVPFSDRRHYYHVAKEIADTTPDCIWTNQFENQANFRAHYERTGPEIWAQTGGKVDGFVTAAGTGGTIAGVSSFLKEVKPDIAVHLIDPPGSALFNYVTSGELKSTSGNTITEGIGIGRITANFSKAKVDGAFMGTDKEAVEMAYYLLRNEGLFVGPSSGLNVAGAVKLAKVLGPGHTIVTILCDSGERYMSKLWSPTFLAKHQLVPTHTGMKVDFVS